MMKKIMIAITVIILLLACLALFRNFIVRNTLPAVIKVTTGLDLQIKSFKVGIFKTALGIEGLKILNPSGFADKVMAEFPEIYLDYNLGTFLKKNVHLTELRINLKEFTVIRNEQGKINLNSLKIVQQQKQARPAAEKKEKKAKRPDINIEKLDLKIGKVVYKDYTSEPPVIKEYNVNIDESFKNITNPQALANIIIVKALASTTIASLANFDLEPLKLGVSQTVQNTGKLITDTAQQAKDAAIGTVKAATDTVKKAGEDVKKLLQLEK